MELGQSLSTFEGVKKPLYTKGAEVGMSVMIHTFPTPVRRPLDERLFSYRFKVRQQKKTQNDRVKPTCEISSGKEDPCNT